MSVRIYLIVSGLIDQFPLTFIFHIFFTSIVTPEDTSLTVSTRNVFHTRTS